MKIIVRGLKQEKSAKIEKKFSEKNFYLFCVELF